MTDVNKHSRLFYRITRCIGITIFSVSVMLLTACDMAPPNVEYKVKDEPPAPASSNSKCKDSVCSSADCAYDKGAEKLNEKCEEKR